MTRMGNLLELLCRAQTSGLLSQRERNEVREKSWNACDAGRPPDLTRSHPHPGPLPRREREHARRRTVNLPTLYASSLIRAIREIRG